MAYKDSDEIKANESYALGEYSFRIERTSVPGSTNDKIEAICTDKDGHNARKSIQVPSLTNLDGYYVEANDDTADVYVLVQTPEGATSSLIPSGQSVPLATDPIASYELINPFDMTSWNLGYAGLSGGVLFGTGGQLIVASSSHIQVPYQTVYLAKGASDPSVVYYPQTLDLGGSFTYDGKTVWFGYLALASGKELYGVRIIPVSYPYLSASREQVAWTLVYGTISDGKPKQMLVGRFKINLEDAGGVGPGSDWDDPGDYDDDWEEGDPTHTLYVTVTGALSGRHNDPIVDPSYSYIPADKATIKDYGCGGDGGHGGGGGAGASTVVVHKFATNQANSKEVTAIARRHGYGSGGGKGGKGGDGCILVYY